MTAAFNSFSDVFSKASDEACVEYFLYPDESVPKDTLDDLLLRINVEASAIIGDYLWQKDPFQLKLSDGHFHGNLNYDINIEDEWFTVHILQQLTQKFPGLIARVIDQDGEFLLIEAAEHLPDWAESDEACQNRVYISSGQIHLVGEFKSDDGCLKASLQEPMEVDIAVKLIRQYPDRTVAEPLIQRTIAMRVGKYPQKFFQNVHHVNLMLPPKVAMILRSKPAVVSAAVRAYHTKDSLDMKAVRLMSTFSPIESLVKTRVRFTKTLYTLLSAGDYYPDLKLKWKFPLPLSPEFKGHSLGAKLTLGFEILFSRGKGKNGPSVDVESTSAWLRYEEKLKQFNYYKDLIEGSREHKELKQRAKTFFQSSVLGDSDLSPDEQESCEVQSLLRQAVSEQNLDTTEGESLPDDDESWMDMDASNLDSLLAAQFKSKISDQKLDQIPEKLKEFMSQMSDFAGVEVHSDGDDGDDEDGDGGLDPLDFRADDFVSAMDKLLSELGKPSKDFDLSEPSSEEEEVSSKISEVEKKYGVRNGHDPKMETLMNAMDEELQGTEVGKSFQSTSADAPPRKTVKAKKRGRGSTANASSSATASTTYEPVDIDMNALTNILESFQSQEDPSGPAANLLRNVGLDISKST